MTSVRVVVWCQNYYIDKIQQLIKQFYFWLQQVCYHFLESHVEQLHKAVHFYPPAHKLLDLTANYKHDAAH